MKNVLGFLLLLFFLTSCKKNEISYIELFTTTPPDMSFIQNPKYQFYVGDTIKSQEKISHDSIDMKFVDFDEKNEVKKISAIKMFYVVPQIFSNIKAVDNSLPYKKSFDPVNNKEFYKYIRSKNDGIFEAYVANKNKIVFKDYIKDFEKGNNNSMHSKEQLYEYLNSKKMKYKVLKDKKDENSGIQYLTLKIISDKDSSINKLTLSKFGFEMRTYYDTDTIPDWNKVTYNKFRY